MENGSFKVIKQQTDDKLMYDINKLGNYQNILVGRKVILLRRTNEHLSLLYFGEIL